MMAPQTLGQVVRATVVVAAIRTTKDVRVASRHDTIQSHEQRRVSRVAVAIVQEPVGPGTLAVLGGIIQKARGPVGTFNSTTGQTVTGYSKAYSYDPRLAMNPPPYYPTTGQYERVSWQVLAN